MSAGARIAAAQRARWVKAKGSKKAKAFSYVEAKAEKTSSRATSESFRQDESLLESEKAGMTAWTNR
jgi:hypothetical protein